MVLFASAAVATPVKERTIDVDARDNKFEAPAVTVRKGTWIRFVNVGRNDHNILPGSEKAEFLHVRTKSFEPDEAVAIQMVKPGRFRYYCSLHGTRAAGMRGVINVKG